MRLFGFQLGRARATRFMGDLIRVQLSPGDVCVLMARSSLSREQAENISAMWRASVGDDVTLIVLDDGMRLGVLSPPQAAEVHNRLIDQQAVELAVTT